MSAATLAAVNGRAGTSPPPSIAFTHVFDNAPLGSPPVTSQPFTVNGNPLLVSASASTIAASTANVSYALKLNAASSPAAGTPEVWINPTQQHFPLVRSWALVTGVAAGEVTLTASAGANAAPNGDDTICATVCELGPGAPLAVRAVVQPLSAQATVAGQPALYQPFVSFGGTLLIRASGSAKQGASGALISFAVDIDGQEVARSELLTPASSAESGGPWHHATTPVDVLVDAAAGPHVVAIRPLASAGANLNTAVDVNDFTSVLVLEQTAPRSELEITPVLVNAPLIAQSGSGTAAFATFASGGGTLVILASASAWSTAPNVMNLALQLDGQPLVTNGTPAVLHGSVNTASMHIPLISNDFVAQGVGAGNHTLALVADANTTTDANDRASITVMELGPSAG